MAVPVAPVSVPGTQFIDIPLTNMRKVRQGCGNTMPDSSDLVSFHSGHVENFYDNLLVLGQVHVQIY